MFLKKKNSLYELMNTVSEMAGVLCTLKTPQAFIPNCINALETISANLNRETTVPEKTVEQLKAVLKFFLEFEKDASLVNYKSVKSLNEQISALKAVFKKEVKAKLNVLFLPYKASMWDSLATVYDAAAKDPDCVAHVVPIPYYQISQNKKTLVYEGGSFPKDLPVTHFENYNLAEEQPDIIFVHNIYDNFNAVTCVPEMYFTSSLKKYTDMLVYVPYHITSFFKIKKGDVCYAYNIPTVGNVDKIVVAGDYVKKAAVRDGIPEEKVLALGSPKIDAMKAALNSDKPLPPEWRQKIKGKTVFVLNTGCMFFTAVPYDSVALLQMVFDMTRYVDKNVVIWRPHPLTLASIKRFIPSFEENYNSFTGRLRNGNDPYSKNVILDETDDYFQSLRAADVLLSDASSLLCTYLLTEKKVVYFAKEMPEGSLVPPDAFYYYYDEKEPWYELAKKFAEGYDPLAKNRRGVAAKVYANTDGTCGEKVYREIKKCVLQKT